MNNLDIQIQDRLQSKGVRYTSGRREVVAALTALSGPRSAAELHQDMGHSIPLSSLYRSLAVLQEGGVLETHHGADTVVRYELAEWLSGHHHHLVCVDCGLVEDVELSRDLERDLERVVKGLTNLMSFNAVGHSLEVAGLCSDCS